MPARTEIISKKVTEQYHLWSRHNARCQKLKVVWVKRFDLTSQISINLFSFRRVCHIVMGDDFHYFYKKSLGGSKYWYLQSCAVSKHKIIEIINNLMKWQKLSFWRFFMKYEFGTSHGDASSTLAEKYLFTFQRNTILNSYLNRIINTNKLWQWILSLFYTKFIKTVCIAWS